MIDTENKEENEGGFTDILTNLIEKIEKPSIKNSLKDSLIINKITSEGVYFITISKVAQLIFSNKENMRYIEEKLSEVMEKSVAIHVTFENKENYFNRKLGIEK
ncbi:MAG: hypothetical protein WCI00_07590 [bacterium]